MRQPTLAATRVSLRHAGERAQLCDTVTKKEHTLAARLQFAAMTRDIIAMGGSAGSIEALKRIICSFPADLSAAVFVVVHLAPWHKSDLPAVFSHDGVLALHPRSGEPIENGRIYVAPPNAHLLIADDRVRLWQGPKENRHRPAINATFRSAAVQFRHRVIGVILSGALDDGTTGLWWIKQFGGVAVVQDPNDAEHPDMPQSAIEHVAVDHVVSADEIGPLLVRLTGGSDEKSMIRR